MAFIIPDADYCDEVIFHLRDDFRCDVNNIIESRTHYIERGDQNALIYYINRYMDTNINKDEKRPNTPAYLIMPKIPKNYQPFF